MKDTAYMQRRVKVSGQPLYKLDIGCKNKKSQGYLGLDLRDFGQEIVWDVCYGIPLPDDTVVEIRMSHFLEHIGEEDLPFLWYEIRRVCVHGGLVLTTTPHADSADAWDVWHKSRWNEKRIEGLAKCWNNGFKIMTNRRNGQNLIADLQVIKR